MYLVVVAWLYVVLMMAVAEVSNANGTVLGAIVTFFLYGLIPLALVVYLMAAPHRRRRIKAREAAERAAATNGPGAPDPASPQPDTGGHAATAAKDASVAPVGKET
ncbi:MAG: hypothetical protein R3E99_03180 [Burkholderiaceae bacterium]